MKRAITDDAEFLKESNTPETNHGEEKSVLFTKYFRVEEELSETGFQRGSNGVTAKCLICQKALRGSLIITSNFVRHLKNSHTSTYEEYVRAKECVKNIETRQDMFNKLVVRYIVTDILPISTVESEAFKNLIAFANPKLSVMSRPVATQAINTAFNDMKNKIKNTIKTNKYFCTAAGVWSTNHRSFLGYTCHWLDPSLNRKSVAIACKRFDGKHSFDRIRDAINLIHSEYGLSKTKVVATVTDNGANFVKAFQEFGINCENEPNECCEDDEYQMVEFPEQFFDRTLPKHIRCAAHTLNLIATTDFMKTLKSNQKFIEEHTLVLQKCTRLWNKINRPKSSEQIKAILGCQLKYPVKTRWNSLYDSVSNLLQHEKKLKELSEKLELQTFTDKDLYYLKDYKKLMAPISNSIDFLQGTEGMVYGLLLPTLATIRVKLIKMQNSFNNEDFNSLATFLLQALELRFKRYFDLDTNIEDAVVASTLYPQVKLNWVLALKDEYNNVTINDVISTVKRVISQNLCSAIEVTPSEKHKFFDFSIAGKIETATQKADMNCNDQLSAYLSDAATSVEMLDKYPALKNAYIKYNASLPSSAEVERLFSFANLLNAPRRGRLSDDNFEKLLLLKANKSI